MSFNLLPSEVVAHILSYLTVPQLGAVVSVSKLWTHLGTSEGIWLEHLAERYNHPFGIAHQDARETYKRNVLNWTLPMFSALCCDALPSGHSEWIGRAVACWAKWITWVPDVAARQTLATALQELTVREVVFAYDERDFHGGLSNTLTCSVTICAFGGRHFRVCVATTVGRVVIERSCSLTQVGGVTIRFTRRRSGLRAVAGDLHRFVATLSEHNVDGGLALVMLETLVVAIGTGYCSAEGFTRDADHVFTTSSLKNMFARSVIYRAQDLLLDKYDFLFSNCCIQTIGAMSRLSSAKYTEASPSGLIQY